MRGMNPADAVRIARQRRGWAPAVVL